MSLNSDKRVVRAPSIVSRDIKVVMLGETNVGKTCMCGRFVQGLFMPQTQMTIGATYSTKIVNIDAHGKVKLQIWDTAGQERFRSMARLYFREAKIGIVCFDITNKQSLNQVEYWNDELRQNAGDNIIIGLAANKCDLNEKRVISEAESVRMADRLGVPLFNTSAMTGEGIVGDGNIFVTMVSRLLGSSEQSDFMEDFVPRKTVRIPDRPQFNGEVYEDRGSFCC